MQNEVKMLSMYVIKYNYDLIAVGRCYKLGLNIDNYYTCRRLRFYPTGKILYFVKLQLQNKVKMLTMYVIKHN